MECDLKIRIMERLAINELLKWKNKEYRKPLIVEGARQVGKTWLVKEFARQNYRQLAYVNFEEMKILQNLFERDMSKHAPSEFIPRMADLWKSLPAQLSKENRKFVYGVVREGARAREYELALQWLQDAGLIYKIYNVKAPRLPLASYEDRAAFKIFVLDVGLLGAMSNLKASTIVAGNSIFTEFKGALTEQYVLQQLILRYEPYYYAKSNSTLKIDFLLQDEEDEIVPLEVKAETNVKAKSLRQFVADNRSKKAYRISMNDYQQEDWVTNVPLYAINDYEF